MKFTPSQLRTTEDVAAKLLDGVTVHEKIMARSIGHIITGALLFDDKFHIDLNNDERLVLTLDRNSCCESRYLVCDDDIPSFVDAMLNGMWLKHAPDIVGSYGEVHECSFFEILTSKGSITLASHNEHNGYYGGTNLYATLYDKDGNPIEV